MENYEKDKMILNNDIVNQFKEELYDNSAYVYFISMKVLAEGATKDYEEF